MKVEILPARRRDLPAIERFLAREWDEWRPVPSAEPMRERNWLADVDDFGLRLMVDGELVGYLGASYSKRPIDGRLERFCAIAPWFVKEEHRKHSLPMLFKMIADKSQHYVNLTPTRPMFKLFSTLGFAKLDEVKLLCFPLQNLAGFRPWRGRLVTETSQIRGVLGDDERRVFDDHLRTRCRHLAIVEGDRVCYLAAGRRVLKNVVFSELLHVGEPALLATQIERVVWRLCRQFRAVGVASDARLLAGANIRAVRYKLNAPPLFRSARIGREKIDNMWSELAF